MKFKQREKCPYIYQLAEDKTPDGKPFWYVNSVTGPKEYSLEVFFESFVPADMESAKYIQKYCGGEIVRVFVEDGIHSQRDFLCHDGFFLHNEELYCYLHNMGVITELWLDSCRDITLHHGDSNVMEMVIS